MRKSTKEYILTKHGVRDPKGNICLETITVRVKPAPLDTLAEAIAKTFERTAYSVIKKNITEMGDEILLALNRISLLQDDLNDEERLIVVDSLYSNINMIYERMLDTILQEVSLIGNQGEESTVMINDVRRLIIKGQQATKEVTELIQSIAPK